MVLILLVFRYTPVPMWATDWANLGDLARNREEFTVDPLGHVARRKAFRDQQQSTDPTEWITRYALGSSAVQRQAAVWPANTPGFRADSTEQERDASGNLSRDREWGWGTLWTGVTGVTRKAEARHFYDAEQRLRVLQRQDDTSDGASFSSAGVWEEYRYDPLGRRVMVRTRRESELCFATAATCVSSITRFVWAGDQLLWELKAPGTEYDDLDATTGSGERFGRVSYTHGGGIDRPLALHKEGHGSLVPHDNWRGQFASGTCIAVNGVGCGSVAWPGWQTNAYHAMTSPPTSENWRGGLVDGMRDATGQMYRRNRYYDPQTGQFTQPDPIGIAGGLNVYGFANGDPVSYADPYGLSATCKPPTPECLQARQAFSLGGGQYRPGQFAGVGAMIVKPIAEPVAAHGAIRVQGTVGNLTIACAAGAARGCSQSVEVSRPALGASISMGWLNSSDATVWGNFGVNKHNSVSVSPELSVWVNVGAAVGGSPRSMTVDVPSGNEDAARAAAARAPVASDATSVNRRRPTCAPGGGCAVP